MDEIRTIPKLLEYMYHMYGELELFTLYNPINKTQKKTTYQELSLLIKEFQSFFPVKKGRIVIYLDSSPEWLKIFFAIVCGGHVAILVDGSLDPEYLLHQIIQSEATLLVTDNKRLTKIETANLGVKLPKILNIDAISFNLNINNIELDIATINPTSLAAIVYTSGSTGSPKGVMLSHQAFCLSVINTQRMILPYRANTLIVLPLWHVYSLANCVLSLMIRGWSLYFIQTMKPNLLLSTLQDCQIVYMGVTPIFCETIYQKFLKGINELPWFERTTLKILHIMCTIMLIFSQKITFKIATFLFKPLRSKISSSFTYIVIGGAMLNPRIIRTLLSWGYAVMPGYGMSELCGCISFTMPLEFKANCVGEVSQSCSVKIINKDNRGVGEICFKTKQLMEGYLNQPELTKLAYTEDGWFKTGDLGYFDEKRRYLYISGRSKDIIVTSGGKNIFPDDIEHYFSHMPYIDEACVYGQGSEHGEDIILVIRLTPGLPEGAIAKVLKSVRDTNATLPSYHQVQRILIASENLPRTNTRKINRLTVKAQFSQK